MMARQFIDSDSPDFAKLGNCSSGAAPCLRARVKELFCHHGFVCIDNFTINAAAEWRQRPNPTDINSETYLYAHWNATCMNASGEKFLVMM